jgi:GTP-binding protein
MSTGSLMFIDEVKIHVKAGDGGRGCVSFLRGKYQPLGGPDGGHGGDGGSVLLEVDPQLNTLLDLTYRRLNRAERGAHGRGKNQYGRKGEDLIIKIPPGTVVKDPETEAVMADLVRPGERYLAAEGGRGGRGNAAFVTSVNQAPRYAQPGEIGQERWLHLELKILAEAGIIGFPNVGKSTLISMISEARPKIASYPFTTLNPQLGVVVGPEFQRIVVADIPGLIEGAHQGSGLGTRFLKHIQRTSILIHMVDLSPGTGREVVGDIQTINRELGSFDRALSEKPQIIVGNKIDLAGSGERRARLEAYCLERSLPFHAVSALKGEGLDELVSGIFKFLNTPACGEAGEK